ncbi:MFS transporter [Conyzicola nivalis]|uniref:MFS transporter n=1 Tax=Conyzicola nivalis TaxID=1477021 RepID=A0A916SN49_9MICO|nr:MFS transporter [Conyzicola nivalis]GGB08377.1 MFS transporter [Conyzicola nivalis]
MSATPPSAPATNAAGALSRHQVVAWRNAMFVIFALCGLALASWVSRLPAVRDELGASTLDMGVLIFGLSFGSILGLLVSSHIIARLGARTTMRWGFVIAPIGLASAGLAATVGPSFPVIFVGLAVFGAAFSICDVGMNVSGAANERALGRAIMPIYHAFFSFGTIVGAGLGALAEALDVPIAAHIGIIALVIVALGQVSLRFLQDENFLADGDEPVADDDHSKSWRGRLSIWRDPRTLLIGVIVLGMAFAEGSANDWLTLAMVDGHGVSGTVGALMFGIFVTAMTVGRLSGVFLLDRFGRVPVLRGSAVLAIIGLVIVIFGPSAEIAIVGIVLWGLGSSLGFPVGMSAAADDPKTAAARVSAVATIGYCAFLVGPPVIGLLGEHFGILRALLVVLVLVVAAGLASGAAREPKNPTVAEA